MATVAPDLDHLHATAERAGRRCCVGAVILDGEQRIFVPRRSPRATLPGIWDLVGGHVEPGESLDDALRREVGEETGWSVVGDPRLVFVSDWELPGAPPRRRREFDFLVAVDGDLAHPTLAPDEHDEYRWVDRNALELFDENAGVDDGLLRRVASAAFAAMPVEEPARPHATIFLGEAGGDIDELRHCWDPVMASEIGAHVTVAYPGEVPDLADMTRSVESAVRRAARFELHLGAAIVDRDPADGVFIEVHDPSGAWQRLRSAIAGSQLDGTIPAHVTIVHPRTSALGPTAWADLHGRELRRVIEVDAVAVTAYDGDRWISVSSHELPG